MRVRAIRLLGAVTAAVGLTLLFFGRGLAFDLTCDDLLVIRPWSPAQLAGVWMGRSEPLGVFATFFRPLTSWFYALSFDAFGLHARAHMWLALLLLALVAALVIAVAWRETQSRAVALTAAVLYLSHPNTSWSTGMWVTNDFHKLAAIAALSGVLLWQRLRDRPGRMWALFAIPCTAAFLIKEDGLMLIPALLTLQAVWIWPAGAGVRRANIRFLATVSTVGAVLGAALVLWRTAAIQTVGAFGVPSSVEVLARNYVRGILYVFSYRETLGPMPALTLAVTLAWMAALIAIVRRMPRDERRLPIIGAVLIAWYSAPLALISNVMRFYLLTIASTFIVAPVIVYLWQRARNTPARLLVGAAALSLVAWTSIRQQHALMEFAPCARLEQECRVWVLDELTTLPPEARAHTVTAGAACSAGHYRPVGDAHSLTWGTSAATYDTMSGISARMFNEPVTMLVQPTATTARLSVRFPDASPETPVDVTMQVDGASRQERITTSDWTPIDLSMAPGVRVWLRHAHRIDLSATQPGEVQAPELRP